MAMLMFIRMNVHMLSTISAPDIYKPTASEGTDHRQQERRVISHARCSASSSLALEGN